MIDLPQKKADHHPNSKETGYKNAREALAGQKAPAGYEPPKGQGTREKLAGYQPPGDDAQKGGSYEQPSLEGSARDGLSYNTNPRKTEALRAAVRKGRAESQTAEKVSTERKYREAYEKWLSNPNPSTASDLEMAGRHYGAATSKHPKYETVIDTKGSPSPTAMLAMADEYSKTPGKEEEALLTLVAVYKRLQAGEELSRRVQWGREHKPSADNTKTYEAIARRARRYARKNEQNDRLSLSDALADLAEKCEYQNRRKSKVA